MIRVAAVQMTSGADRGENLAQAGRLVAQAAEDGARFVLLPENFAIMGRSEQDKVTVGEEPGAGVIQDFLYDCARRYALWLAAGTVPLYGSERDKVCGSCLLYDPEGRQVARYDKIHLFDVELDDGSSYRESDSTSAGEQPMVVPTPLAVMGLSICYDLRFPELYRGMHAEGVEWLLVPSAFTEQTGRAHWELLLRARAVENLCYVIAANQGGIHPGGRATYGHSQIVSPWGKVLACADSGPDVICADLDQEELHALRRRFPVLRHRRIGYSVDP